MTTDYGCVGRATCMYVSSSWAKIAAGELFETEEGGSQKMTSQAQARLVIKFGWQDKPELVLSFVVGVCVFSETSGLAFFSFVPAPAPPLRGPPFSHRAPPLLSSCPPRSPRSPRHVACRPAVPASASRHVLPLVPHSTRPAPLVRCIVYM